ncbi:SMI1/KNR4 family protein [Bacillus sp. sid0103]|uniref:SMI1/KNR4 family protein n=1 Tax=Bacillus sp. sid0103 TaxID=2856337 RepID=UPI001C46ACEF|nr:SMI1/KNR4 family protein [Bacillus sp. sid0103]MBV7509621.1 SMI1/KNR4 family protein [Bacillus sp. sid0103]
MNILNDTLNGLKKRLDKDHTIYIQQTQGLTYEVTCEFNPPASIDEIKMLEERLGWSLPQDYKEFLLRHNGANLLFQPGIGEGIELYSIEQILEMRESHQEMEVFEKDFYSIGTCRDGMILINAELCKPNPNRDSNYLNWLMDCSSEEDIIDLKTNFEIWLDRIIAAQGDDYWNWSIISAENHYKYR